MTRQFLSAAVLGLIGAGAIVAQAPKPVPAANVAPPAAKASAKEASAPASQAPAPGTMVLRTKGQPDRKVVIIKSTKTDNGRVFTEVRDIATGETFLVADQTAGGAKDVPAKNPNASMPTMPKAAPKPEAKKAAASPPKAKPRDGDPLLSTAKAKEVPASKAKSVVAASPAKAEPKKLPASAMKAEANAMPSPFAADKPQPVLMPKTAPANDPIHVVLPVGYVPPEFRMKTETADTMTTLQSAMRPTARQDAATALAEGRYADKMEIKMALAHSAMHDPAPVVRAHCIDCLSKLGYCAPDYVDHLRQCSMASEMCLKVAATNALAKLEPKK